MNYVIGIDGGGTKTTGVISNSKGEIFAEVTVGATNPNSVEKDRLQKEFAQLFKQLKAINHDAFDKVSHLFAGLSGAAHMATRNEMKQLIEALLPASMNVTVDHDAITALYSGTLGRPGIVQIAGTGAIAFGINSQYERKRVGGWGYLFSDQGSGYSLGRDALEEIFLAYDGLHKETLLTEKILTHFQVHEPPELIRLIYRKHGKRELIASLSRLVMETADEGDETALNIVYRNGKHLGKSIASLVKQLFQFDDNKNRLYLKSGKRIPVILVGGLLNRFDLLEDPIVVGLSSYEKAVDLIIPSILPVGGAVIAALKEKDIQIDDKFIHNFCK